MKRTFLRMRIWNIKDKKMIYFPIHNSDFLKYINFQFIVTGVDNDLYATKSNRYVFMYPIEAEDKNQEEIWELDIVENQIGNRGIVRYDKDNACYYVDGFEFKHWYDLEVIGNIFENSELLIGGINNEV